MAGDKREGDDLFEDLDKFFAPIKDVDWDEPASTGARETPSEEHVSVRPSEPGSEAAAVPPAQPEDHEEAAWYETGVIEAIEGIDGPDEDDIVEIADAEDGDRPLPDPHPDQSDLFGDDVDAGVDTDTAAWVLEEVDPSAGPAFEPAEAGPGAYALDEGDPEPTDDDLEAAAEHFAGSVRDEGLEPETAATGEEEPPRGAEVPIEPGEVEESLLADLEEPQAPPPAVMVGGGEGLGGPSWQDPGAVEVGADLESRRGPDADERDVPAAFLTGIVLAGVALATLLVGKWAFALLATGVAVYAQVELYGVMRRSRKEPATAVGLVTGALIMAAGYYRGEQAVLAMFVLGTLATFLWFMAVPAAHRKDTISGIGHTLFGVAWIPVLASYLLVLLDQANGTSLVITVIGLTFVFDAAAFLGGSVTGGQFFRRPLAPSVSPKKSIEGVIIATLVTMLVSVALVTSFVKPFEDMRLDTAILALVVAAAATFGDLAESLIKRDVGIKDMSNVLPGHGGLLDRIDSLLFVAPATFLFFRVVFA